MIYIGTLLMEYEVIMFVNKREMPFSRWKAIGKDNIEDVKKRYNVIKIIDMKGKIIYERQN